MTITFTVSQLILNVRAKGRDPEKQIKENSEEMWHFFHGTDSSLPKMPAGGEGRGK
jgi:hypothetical protein